VQPGGCTQAIEEFGVVDHDAVEHSVELLGIDAVRALHLPVQAWCGRLDVDVADASVEQVSVERALELASGPSRATVIVVVGAASSTGRASGF
jgi:hypothetical protein